MPIPPAGHQAYAKKPQPALADAEKAAAPKNREAGVTQTSPSGATQEVTARHKATEMEREKLLGAALRKQLPATAATESRVVTLPSTKPSGDIEPAPNSSITDTVLSKNAQSGLRTLDMKLRIQADIDDRLVKQISMSTLNDGSANLENGTYVFIVTKSDPQSVRLFNDSNEK